MCGGEASATRNQEYGGKTNMRKSWTLSIPALDYNLSEGLLKSPRDRKTARSISCKLFLQF